jgi:hypothetical protein
MRDAPDVARRVLGLRRGRLEKLAPDRVDNRPGKATASFSRGRGVIRSRPKNGRQSAARFVSGLADGNLLQKNRNQVKVTP